MHNEGYQPVLGSYLAVGFDIPKVDVVIKSHHIQNLPLLLEGDIVHEPAEDNDQSLGDFQEFCDADTLVELLLAFIAFVLPFDFITGEVGTKLKDTYFSNSPIFIGLMLVLDLSLEMIRGC